MRSLGFKAGKEEWVEAFLAWTAIAVSPSAEAIAIRNAGREQGVDVRRFGRSGETGAVWVQGPLVKP